MVKRIILCVLVAASGLAEQPRLPKKPACNAAARGRFWPEVADSDPKLARKLSRCGSLEICTMSGWHYKWQLVMVNVRQLGKTPQDPSLECVALVAEATEKER